MSKSSANDWFVREMQIHLMELGLYSGYIDGWAGPLTVGAWRESIGAAVVPAPPIDVPEAGDGPLPAPGYRLPRETDAEMTAFYGAPSKSPGYLDWFSFPDEETRLYNRIGTRLQDRAGDERLDHKCHKLLVGRLTAALAEIYVRLGQTEFRRQGWHVYGGCHNYRKKTGGRSLSTHSWGVAVDVNPGENPYQGSKPTFSDEAINTMERWGFLSGGRAWGRDWMHFQAVIPNISSGSYYDLRGLPKNIVAA